MTTETLLPPVEEKPAMVEEAPRESTEQLKLRGEQLVEKVKELIHQGNVRRMIVKHEGHVIMEIPVTVGVIGIALAPTLAAVGAIAALVTDCTLEVIRVEEETCIPAD